jgi:hypothetical protein
LKKLGLDQLPHAVACAQYHYLSNQVGGVKVEYVYESDTKAWVRYPPPRWIWSGTAICGIPSEVSRAMLRGWHANNGVVLGNPRLGFVCTGQTVDGQPGLEATTRSGIAISRPRSGCSFRPASAVRRSAPISRRACRNTWPESGCRRCCAITRWRYITSIVPETISVLGPEEGGHLAGARPGWSECTLSTTSLRCSAGWKAGAAGFRQGLRAAVAAQDDDAQLQLEGACAP